MNTKTAPCACFVYFYTVPQLKLQDINQLKIVVEGGNISQVNFFRSFFGTVFGNIFQNIFDHAVYYFLYSLIQLYQFFSFHIFF